MNIPGHPVVAHNPRRAFTLIEVLVVVAIIALLIAILLPSLKAARESARGSVCGHNMRTVTGAGLMWMTEIKKEVIPAHRGWAPHALKALSGVTEAFNCPSNDNPVPISPVLISQYRAGFTYPQLSTDSGYFLRKPTPEADGSWKNSMETEADVAGGDRDFDDAYVYVKPAADKARTGEVWAVKAGTGRALTLFDWRGKTLAENFSSTPRFKQPVLWGSFGMNLSAAVPGMKPWHVLYAEYTDWTVCTESQLGVMGLVAGTWRVRGDLDRTGPRNEPRIKTLGAYRHNAKANIAFMDSHVEKAEWKRMAEPRLWHAPRPVGWTPPPLSTN